MRDLPDGTKSRSPIEAVVQWFRDLTKKDAATELSCCGDEEVERMAKDVGVSASELRTLASQGPRAADLLLKRMAVLDLDQNEISRTARRTLQDMQRVCSMCDNHKQCARDLARDPADPAWKDYCPNAATLIALNGLPWAARREW